MKAVGRSRNDCFVRGLKCCLLFVMLVLFSCKHDDDHPLHFIGDSIVEIWDLHQSFSSFVTYNHGLTNSGIAFIEKNAHRFRHCHVVVLTGGNDLHEVFENPEEPNIAYFERYEQAVAALDADCIYLFSLLPRGDGATGGDPLDVNPHIQQINHQLYLMAQRHGWIYIDAFTPFLQKNLMNPSYSQDGIHPNALGYELLTSLLHHKLL